MTDTVDTQDTAKAERSERLRLLAAAIEANGGALAGRDSDAQIKGYIEDTILAEGTTAWTKLHKGYRDQDGKASAKRFQRLFLEVLAEVAAQVAEDEAEEDEGAEEEAS